MDAVPGVVRTARLELRAPVDEDVDALHALLSDPRVWTHYPSLRHVDRARTVATVRGWRDGWREHGLDTWVVRERGAQDVLGYGGCSIRSGVLWNLGYRLAPEAQGRGVATELARAAIGAAAAVRPELPVVAYLLEHNRASAAVAERVGLALVARAPDAGNPDPDAVRLVHADRALTPEQLAAAFR